MNFNFRDQYQTYSTAELLKIVKQPDAYQPDAVAAATEILQERTITEADEEEATQYLQQKELGKQAVKKKVEGYVTQFADVFQPVEQARYATQQSKWLNIIVNLFYAECLWIIYQSVIGIILFFNFPFYEPNTSLVFNFVAIPATLAALYCLYHKKREGWMLLFIINLAAMTFPLWLTVYHSLRTQEFKTQIYRMMKHEAPKAIFLWLLWKELVTDYYGIDYSNKIRMLKIGVAIGFIIAFIFIW